MSLHRNSTHEVLYIHTYPTYAGGTGGNGLRKCAGIRSRGDWTALAGLRKHIAKGVGLVQYRDDTVLDHNLNRTSSNLLALIKRTCIKFGQPEY